MSEATVDTLCFCAGPISVVLDFLYGLLSPIRASASFCNGLEFGGIYIYSTFHEKIVARNIINFERIIGYELFSFFDSENTKYKWIFFC